MSKTRSSSESNTFRMRKWSCISRPRTRLIVPYIHIFQSGVPFLAYSFGLPVIATDVGSLREDIVEGRTGFVCQPRDSSDLARTIDKYFESELFRDLENRRLEIKEYANERYSWNKVAAITTASLFKSLILSHNFWKLNTNNSDFADHVVRFNDSTSLTF